MSDSDTITSVIKPDAGSNRPVRRPGRRKKNGGISLKYSVLWAFTLIAAALTAAWMTDRFLLSKPACGQTELTHIRYSFTLKNLSARLIKNVDFRVYGPVQKTATQVCETVDASHPYELIHDACGNQILHFSFAQIAPYGVEIISLQSRLRVWKKPKPIICGSRPEMFLMPEPFVESDHPVLKDQAQALKQSDTLSAAESIFKWVSGRIRFSGYSAPERGAWYAFSQGKGDCTEYMDLFAALCRAAGIPCRRIGGYICPKDQVVSGAGYHNWAEFYADGRWHIADPMNRVFAENPAGYIAVL